MERTYTAGFEEICLTGRRCVHRLVRMDSNLASPGSPDAIAAPPPPPFPFEPLLVFKPVRLRPLWIGLLLASLELAFALYARFSVGNDLLVGLGTMFSGLSGVTAIVYYFMSVHRLIRVLRTQPDWWSEYTPAGVVWRQFIPFYGLYVLYQWTSDVESYVNWRLGITSKAGLMAFIGLLVGFGFSDFHPVAWIGFFLMTGSLALLYHPVERALMVAPPADGAAPRYDGTLGLR
jgi:hypothetical protein